MKKEKEFWVVFDEDGYCKFSKEKPDRNLEYILGTWTHRHEFMVDPFEFRKMFGIQMRKKPFKIKVRIEILRNEKQIAKRQGVERKVKEKKS